MAKYDNIGVDGKNAFTGRAPGDVRPKEETAPVEEKKSTNPVDDVVVQDVIAGKYGTGKTRAQKLAEAGYDPDEVQAKVNKAVKAKPAEEPKPETPKAEAPKTTTKEIVEQTTEDPNTDKQDTEKTQETNESELPKNVQAELDSSDEGQQANAAVQANDPAALQNIVTPEGLSVLKGSFDAKGNYVPYTYTEEDTRLVKNKGLAACLTIISAAISALGVAAGIPIVPINFLKFGASPQKDLERMNQVEKDYAKLMNAGTAEAQEIEKTRSTSQKANISDVEAYKGLSNEDVQKAAQVNASVGGQNTQLDVQREAQAWEAKQKELDREFQKEMNNLNTDSQIAILKQQAINAQDLATLMNDLDVQKVFKKIEYGKAHGMSADDVAKWIRAEQGTTKLMAGMKMGTDAANAAANIVGTFMPGGSDKNMKKFVYDGKAANSKMLSSKRKFW